MNRQVMMTAEPNNQIQRAFWKRINGSLKPSNIHPLSFSNGYHLLDSLIHSREPGTNQGGANVRHYDTQAQVGLGSWLNNVAYGINLFLPKAPTRAHKSQNLKPHIAQKPEE